MAELVDAHDSGSCEGNLVEVRVFSSAPTISIVLLSIDISPRLSVFISLEGIKPIMKFKGSH